MNGARYRVSSCEHLALSSQQPAAPNSTSSQADDTMQLNHSLGLALPRLMRMQVMPRRSLNYSGNLEIVKMWQA
jgi:hypothetical protein